MTPSGIKTDPANLTSTWGRTAAVIGIVVVCLAAADRFLAKVESAEARGTAERSYAAGSRLLEEGKAADALEPLREAHAAERQNPDYQVQLITALTAAGKTGDAESLLTDLLQREPNDGRANLIAARLMIKEGNLTEAGAYYHRAIYGEWPGDPAAHRVAARMELIDLLARKNQKQELLGELISLEAEAGRTGEIQSRMAELFLLAGAPARAANVYEAIAAKNPADIEAWEGVGEAELEQGQYAAAHEAFLRAFLRDPNNGSVRVHLQTLNTVTALDPTQRRLTSAEKYRRSIRILDMARASFAQCDANPSNENAALLKMADAAIAAKSPAHVTNEISEGVLSLAEKLWHAETVACADNPSGTGTPDRNPLNLLMMKLAS